jgi:ABC-type multidrug transport system fused ATPase/permease subunit
MVLGSYVGFSRLYHLRFIARGPILAGVLKVSHLPPQSTFWRFLASLSVNVVAQILSVQRQIRERVWAAANVQVSTVTLDTDTTVHTLYGNQMGARKSYNPKNRAKKSCQPMLTFIAETREYLWGGLRNGDRPSGKEIARHIAEAVKALPSVVKRILARADSGFYCWDAVEAYEKAKCQFILVARKTSRLLQQWLCLGRLGLAPAFVSGVSSPATLAVGIGGTLLAFRAFRRLAGGLWQLVGAAVAWEQVAPVFHAASRPQAHGPPAAFLPRRDDGKARVVIEAHDLVFRYRERAEPVLRNCSLRVSSDDRLVLDGPSGGGKSTLASLLAGLRQPESGLLFVGGLDRNSLGAAGWRRIVAAAPQFHENHVLTGTFAFNLLMGRPGLPGPADMEEAEAVCRELGLSDVLSRMPAGLLQLVGETGWQLSRGERSRLYIARALLQGADLVVLDESFAALDPENLRLALDCVDRRARAVLAIAHR